MDYQRKMEVALDNTTLDGTVVSGTFSDWQELWSAYNPDEINWLPNDTWNAFYGVSMTVKSGSTWNVTGQSVLSSLTIEDGASVTLPEGYVLYVDGTATELSAGTYTGVVAISDEPVSMDAYTATSPVSDDSQIVQGTEYTEADDAYVTIADSAGDYASETATGAADYRAALFVDESGLNESKSVFEAI